jgi:HSP20 family molecular chaperone IbpA
LRKEVHPVPRSLEAQQRQFVHGEGAPAGATPPGVRPLFDHFYGGFPALFDPEFGRMRWRDLGVEDRGNEVVVRAEPPGFEEKDLDVQLHDNLLTIRAMSSFRQCWPFERRKRVEEFPRIFPEGGNPVGTVSSRPGTDGTPRPGIRREPG